MVKFSEKRYYSQGKNELESELFDCTILIRHREITVTAYRGISANVLKPAQATCLRFSGPS